jgi:RimJ/RimL family protein N-acetyltransferase
MASLILLSNSPNLWRMNMGSIPLHQLITDRLVLRPTSVLDAGRAFEIQSDWEVTRMLRMASFPPSREGIVQWFADHPRQWAAGEAYRFGVELLGRLIGVVDIDEISPGEGELGYWFDQANWGQGYAPEAARSVVRFAFCDVGLQRLRSGHAVDNLASASVLLKLGFRPLDTVQRMSRSRGEEIMQRRCILTSPNSI